MTTRRAILTLPAGLAAGLLRCGPRGDSGTRVSIGAMPPGTSWYVFAATLSGLLESSLPPGMSVEVIARGGGVGNPILVDRGNATIALSQAATAAWAFYGNARAYKGEKHQHIRALVGGLNRVWMVAMLREEYIARTGNDSLEKAIRSDSPLRIIMKPNDSTVPVVADMILETFGASRETITAKGGEVIQVSANQIPSILRDGRADLYFETAIQGHPTVMEVATTVPVRFEDLPDEVLEKLRGPGVTPIPMPQWFPGQVGPLKSVDMGTILIANQDLSGDLAYLITKTVCENRDKMVAAHKAWADFDPATAGSKENTAIPLHPGAERYYREKGSI